MAHSVFSSNRCVWLPSCISFFFTAGESLAMHYNVPSSRTGHSLRSDECIYASVLGVKTNVSLLLGKSANRNPLGCETVNKPRLPSANCPDVTPCWCESQYADEAPIEATYLGC